MFYIYVYVPSLFDLSPTTLHTTHLFYERNSDMYANLG